MNRKLLIIGAVLGLVTVILMNYRIGEIESSQKKLAFLKVSPEQSLAAGDEIRLGMLSVVYLPEDFNSMSKVAIRDTPETREWLSGRRVNRDIAGGTFLLYEFLREDPENRFAASISESSRAMTIPVNAMSSVGYFVEPGSRVDILGTLQEVTAIPGAAEGSPGSARIVTKTILQNVLVLAVDRATSRGTYLREIDRGYGTVTIEVTPVQSEILVFAMQHVQGGLTLTLRNPGNTDTASIPSVSWDALSN